MVLPEPSAIVGIQLVPMAPVSAYLGTDAAGGGDQIGKLVEAAAPAGFDIPFGDYLLMYSSLAGREQAGEALAAARALPTATIDDGNSRSYLLAYIMANAS
ncbi:hypothetical protein [Naasia aerilata]|uniref:Uncharacterized protein n=1 Tax=Naasia aerilata TaxID=1162966 RepID=A0ABM8GC22_9MICO|nr:hypothetical protein [Naasia aerilata]BDZ45795.1 hypothetical protein GCM10025866_17040 [Naasia aerilata]